MILKGDSGISIHVKKTGEVAKSGSAPNILNVLFRRIEDHGLSLSVGTYIRIEEQGLSLFVFLNP